MISKNKSSLQISMSKDSVRLLDNIVEDGRKSGMKVTRSLVLEAALLYFIVQYQKDEKENQDER